MAAQLAAHYSRNFFLLILLVAVFLALARWFSPLDLIDVQVAASYWRDDAAKSAAIGGALDAAQPACGSSDAGSGAAVRDLADVSSTVLDPRAVQFGGKPLCWWSGDHGGYGWDHDGRDSRRKTRDGSASDSGDRRGGVLMFGNGCMACVAGQWCSFEIEIRPPARWVFPVTEAFVDLLIVELWGPAIAYAEVKKDGIDNKRWRVSYRVWDAGVYIVTVTSGCSTLNYSRNFADQGMDPFANWTLTVANPFASYPDAQAFAQLPETPSANLPKRRKLVQKEGTVGGEGDRDWRREAELEWTRAPCDQSVEGRWFFRKGTYRWHLFPCASPMPPPTDWVEALQARGIKEISFVGDSHQRFLMLFINYLIAHEIDDSLWKYHGDIVINVPPPKGRKDLQPLRLNFYWVDGTYQNDEYGCIRRGYWSHRYNSFPNVSVTADVTIIDGGFWSACQCDESEQAFSKHLPEYVSWARRQLDRLQLWQQEHGKGKHAEGKHEQGKHVEGKPAKAKEGAKEKPRRSLKEGEGGRELGGKSTEREVYGKPWMLYRSIVPWRANGKCGGLIPTNSLIEHMNGMIRAEILRYGIGYLDGWAVEAPRYFDTCSEKDLHYTCHKAAKGLKNGMFHGEVGEAMVLNTIYTLLYKLW